MFKRAGIDKVPGLWGLMLTIAIVAGIPRFYWMLTGQYNAVVIIFIVFAVLPALLINKEAQKAIGFTRISLSWILGAFVIGGAAAGVVYLIGYLLFENSDLNWFVAIAKTFDKDGIIDQLRPNILFFLAFSLPVMTFSPLGEEFFFRGLIHESFAQRFSPAMALAADAILFGVTHLAHYGLYMDGGSLQFFPSAVIWIVLMSLTAVLFYVVKRYSGSIWGAVLCHAGFNFGMMGIVFYVIH